MLRRVTISRAAVIGGVAVAVSLAAVPGARAAVARQAGAPVRGLDISAYQHAGAAIDWALLAAQGIRFVAIKASEGTYYLNPYYASDARGAEAAGLRVLPYAFANPGGSGAAATANFATDAASAARAAARLPLVIDLENDPYKKATDCYGLGVTAMVSWIAGFTARAWTLTGEWPIIYTTRDWWRECTGSTGRFPHDPLWLAAFGGTAPTVPAPWQSWTFWQYDNGGSLPGIGHTDLDYYQPTGGLPELRTPARPRRGKRAKLAKPAKSKHHPRPESRDEKPGKHGKHPKHPDRANRDTHKPKPDAHKDDDVSPRYHGKT
jgi:lysozyme